MNSKMNFCIQYHNHNHVDVHVEQLKVKAVMNFDVISLSHKKSE